MTSGAEQSQYVVIVVTGYVPSHLGSGENNVGFVEAAEG